MPFASATFPSIALTQLRSVLEAELGDQVEIKIFYLTHDVARYFGSDAYEMLSGRVEASTAGLGDWLFRDVAFPGSPDNAETYFRRNLVEQQMQQPMLKSFLLMKRQGLGRLMEELIDQYKLASYQVVGFTSMFSQNVPSLAMARLLKKRNPGIVTVLGGANCETVMGRVIARNTPFLDFVFSGPSLRSFPELVRRLMAGDEGGCHQITGVYSRRKLAHAPSDKLEIGEELDIDVDVPLDYDDFLASLEEKLGSSVRPDLLFETSRGCWWGERSHCTFCGLNGMTMAYRAMAPEKAVRYLQDLFDRYGDRVASFRSVDNILPRPYLTDVLPHLRPPDHIAIFYEVKADLKDREVEILADARVTLIQPGIEALATSTLGLMKKGTTSFQNLRFLRSCMRRGIEPLWNLLIGFPGETEEVYRKYVDDLPLLVHLHPPSGVFSVRFDRFSPYHKKALEYGLKLKPMDFYGMVYPYPEADLEDLAYYFLDQNYDAPYALAAARWLGKLRERVNAWKARWQGRDGKLAPELTWKSDGSRQWVYDTRSGLPVQHELGELGIRALDLLTHQQKLPQLAERLQVSLEELEGEMRGLKERGLVFEERDIYMSLVMRDAVPAAPFLLGQESGVGTQTAELA